MKYLDKIVCGDVITVLKELPENYIDLVVTSPPYNLGIKYDVWEDKLPTRQYFKWCETWLKELYRVLKPDGRVCLNILLEMGVEGNKKRISPYAEFYHLFRKIGIKPFGSPVWAENHKSTLSAWGSWLSASAPYVYCPYEIIMIGYKEIWKKQKRGKSTIDKKEFIEACSGVWDIASEHRREHPAPFPKKLAERCIRLFSFEEDVVLDPFVGQGTTAIVAQELDRHFIGIDISPTYCKMARKVLSMSLKHIFRKKENDEQDLDDC